MFYDVADELGILLWHDLMFACAMYPTDTAFLHSVETEVMQQVHKYCIRRSSNAGSDV